MPIVKCSGNADEMKVKDASGDSLAECLSCAYFSLTSHLTLSAIRSNCVNMGISGSEFTVSDKMYKGRRKKMKGKVKMSFHQSTIERKRKIEKEGEMRKGRKIISQDKSVFLSTNVLL